MLKANEQLYRSLEGVEAGKGDGVATASARCGVAVINMMGVQRRSISMLDVEVCILP